MTNIRSETQFVITFIKSIVLLPFLLILSPFSKKSRKRLIEIIKDLRAYFKEAKWTTRLIYTNIIIFIIEVILLSNNPNALDFVVKYQTNLIFPNTIISIICSMFLHGSIAHLLGNMFTLSIFGRIVEREYDNKILFIYFGSGFIGSALSILMNQPGIGASGAIAGLIATAILVKPFYLTYHTIIPTPIIMIGWLAIMSDTTAILEKWGILKASTDTIDDNIGHFAHLGGYIAIMFLMYLMEKRDRKKLLKGLIINIVFISSVVLINIIIS